MKMIRFIFWTVTTLLLASGGRGALVVWGPLNVEFTGVGQDKNDVQTKSSPPTFTWSTTNATYKNADIIALLANSFNTNFPAGAQLAVACGRVGVADSTGTNLIQDVSSVISLSAIAYMKTGTQVGTHGYVVGSEGFIKWSFVTQPTFNYDDS